jgi:anti-sigma-K factor RskA
VNGVRARLEAYRDGELAPFARWRLERRLRRDPALRRALAELESLATLLREVDAEGPEPDLWEGIRLRLGAVDARRAESARAPWGRAPRYLALGAVGAGAVALALLLNTAQSPPSAPAAQGAVRWIDARGHPTMVLRDDAGATIIWVPDRAS